MSRVRAGAVKLGWRSWGDGDDTVVFIHGNLASKDWLASSAPFFPRDLRVVAIDWRGCGDSDRPPATENYANYSMEQHAEDMLSALDSLEIPFCHLATHSTGGIIAARMLLKQPHRFGRVLALDPVTPLGMQFNDQQLNIFRKMMADHNVARSVMATAASSLFDPSSLAQGLPKFRREVGEARLHFERILKQTATLSEGVWIGTPFNLNLEFNSGELARRMPGMIHPHLVVWGEDDPWIPLEHIKTMVSSMPNCRLVVVPGIGHSMNIESPAMYAGYFGSWFGSARRCKRVVRRNQRAAVQELR